MDKIYSLLINPGLGIALGVFFGGLLLRFVLYFFGLDWKLDRVAYRADLGRGLKGGAWSAFRWLLPFGTRGWRAQPFAAAGSLLMHLGVVLVPLFLIGHNAILRELFGYARPTLPQGLADVLTLCGVTGICCMLLRRLTLPEVRILSSWEDYLISLLLLFLFVTGFMAARQLEGYKYWLLCHALAGEFFMIIAPFTKLSHISLFFASRLQIGMDYAIKRGGRSRESGSLFPW